MGNLGQNLSMYVTPTHFFVLLYWSRHDTIPTHVICVQFDESFLDMAVGGVAMIEEGREGKED